MEIRLDTATASEKDYLILIHIVEQHAPRHLLERPFKGAENQWDLKDGAGVFPSEGAPALARTPKPTARRGKKSKLSQDAQLLHEALKEPDGKSSQDAQHLHKALKKSDERPSQDAQWEDMPPPVNYEALGSASLPPPPPPADNAELVQKEEEAFPAREETTPSNEELPQTHEELVAKLKQEMMWRGHVWIRNVLNAHKKEAKTTLELSVETLRAILADPSRYEDLV